MSRSWRDIARSVINQVILDTPTQPIRDYLARVKAAIDAAYPFEMRKNHPYKQWLEERAAAFNALGIIQSPARKRFSRARNAPKQDLTVPGQLSLLEQTRVDG